MTTNFDQIIERRGSDAVKWKWYPQDVLPMWVADMDFLSPTAVISSLKERVEHGVFGYSWNPENLDETICRWAEEHYGMRITPDHLLYVPGVVTGFNMVARSFVSAGEGIMFQPPIYPPFYMMEKHYGVENHTVDLVQDQDGNYGIDFDALEAGVKPNTKMFLLCNPHNPVGRVFTKKELEGIAEFCIEHDLILCSDEIHCDLIFGEHRHIPVMNLDKEITKRSVMLFAPSKTFNIAGLGFSVMAVKNKTLMEQIKKTTAGLLPHPDLLAARAALAAYRDGEQWLDELIVYLQGNRDYLVDFVGQNLPGIKMTAPEGTYLAWLDCRESQIADDPHKFFLEKAKVGLNNGCDFGAAGKGFVRLNFGCPRAVLQDGLQRMQAAFSQVN